MAWLDSESREKIVNDLAKNIIVEAAAGTGKTTCLVARMLNIIKKDKQHIHQLAAITFTKKAANELQERFHQKLLDSTNSSSGIEKENFQYALSNLNSAFIGTIHSFCNKLLREYPIEAEIDPYFKEIDAYEDEQIRKRSWEIFISKLENNFYPELLNKLHCLEIIPEELENDFIKFLEHSDVTSWPTDEEKDITTFAKTCRINLEKYLESIIYLKPIVFSAPQTNDKLMPTYKKLFSFQQRTNAKSVEELNFINFISNLPNPRDKSYLVQKSWVQLGLSAIIAKEELEHYQEFYEENFKKLKQLYLSQRYIVTIRAFLSAKEIYINLKKQQSLLSFTDLLVFTNNMLKKQLSTRKQLNKKFQILLVDEFQDTDPLQAELMFLLTAKNYTEINWKKCLPKPGSLFIVGDPKQSIYRFRRADISVYNTVKSLIVKNQGEYLTLSTNFRSDPKIINFVNQAFKYREAALSFPEQENEHSPAYINLVAANNKQEELNFETIAPVSKLTIVKYNAKTETKLALKDEAKSIAQIIYYAINKPLFISSSVGEKRKIVPDDFMIITPNKKYLPVYAEELYKLNIPCIVSGAGGLKNAYILNLLIVLLKAIAESNNQVHTLALLRSELFGIADSELYRWKKNGNNFDYLQTKTTSDEDKISKIFKQLRKYHYWSENQSPLQFCFRLIRDIDLWQYSCLGESSYNNLSVLTTIFTKLQASDDKILTLGQLITELEYSFTKSEEDLLPFNDQTQAVRLMNLHKTKGLEAPITFLASPFSNRSYLPSLHVIRQEDTVEGFMEFTKAKKLNWEELQHKEEEFYQFEKLRLLYVAATRAKKSLIISVNKNKNFWDFFNPYLAAVPEITVNTLNTDLKEIIYPDFSSTPQKLLERGAIYESLKNPTYQQYQAKGSKQLKLELYFPEERDKKDLNQFNLSPEESLIWGSLLHSLIELSAKNKNIDDNLIVEKLKLNQLPLGLLSNAKLMLNSFFTSNVWQRAKEAKQIFYEIPFSFWEEDKNNLTRGAIDLVFQEKDGWVIVDYKSDKIKENMHGYLLAKYKEQLDNYKKFWEAMTSEPVKELGLYLLHLKKYYHL